MEVGLAPMLLAVEARGLCCKACCKWIIYEAETTLREERSGA
jgi:hypothetical protein